MHTLVTVGALVALCLVVGWSLSMAEDYALASWYGPGFDKKLTASGSIFNQMGLSAAHKTLPLGTKLRLYNPETKKAAVVTVNDRGPYVEGRDLDLSKGAAQKLGTIKGGVAKLQVKVLAQAGKQTPVWGHDQPARLAGPLRDNPEGGDNAGITVPGMPPELLGPTGRVFLHPDGQTYSTHLNTTMDMPNGKTGIVPLLVPGQTQIDRLLAGKKPSHEQLQHSIDWMRTFRDRVPTYDTPAEAQAAEKDWHDWAVPQMQDYVQPYLGGVRHNTEPMGRQRMAYRGQNRFRDRQGMGAAYDQGRLNRTGTGGLFRDGTLRPMTRMSSGQNAPGQGMAYGPNVHPRDVSYANGPGMGPAYDTGAVHPQAVAQALAQLTSGRNPAGTSGYGIGNLQGRPGGMNIGDTGGGYMPPPWGQGAPIAGSMNRQDMGWSSPNSGSPNRGGGAGDTGLTGALGPFDPGGGPGASLNFIRKRLTDWDRRNLAAGDTSTVLDPNSWADQHPAAAAAQRLNAQYNNYYKNALANDQSIRQRSPIERQAALFLKLNRQQQDMRNPNAPHRVNIGGLDPTSLGVSQTPEQQMFGQPGFQPGQGVLR